MNADGEMQEHEESEEGQANRHLFLIGLINKG